MLVENSQLLKTFSVVEEPLAIKVIHYCCWNIGCWRNPLLLRNPDLLKKSFVVTKISAIEGLLYRYEPSVIEEILCCNIKLNYWRIPLLLWTLSFKATLCRHRTVSYWRTFFVVTENSSIEEILFCNRTLVCWIHPFCYGNVSCWRNSLFLQNSCVL
jgi:hypothetical protein